MTEISFLHEYNFDDSSIKLIQGQVGIYFIYLANSSIGYPFGKSKLIYLGLSELKQNTIGRRLRAHLSGQSGNLCIKNYAARSEAKFTFHTFELLRNLGMENLYDIESFFLSDFMRTKGAYPICNGQAGVTAVEPFFPKENIRIDWSYFS